jgi:PAS domain S-box-containing protein
MRFSEMDTLLPNQYDFVPRERRWHIWQVIVAFALAIALIFIAAYAPFFKALGFYSPVAVVLVITALCLYVVYRKQINLDLVMSTEYQNMLFAQAFRVGSSFAMIVRRDGTILHADESMSTIFPRYHFNESQALETIFGQGVVRTVDRERVMGAIRSATSDHLIFPITDEQGIEKNYILTVDPLPRPSGFCLLRGREYLGQRAGSELLPDILRSTSIDKLDHLLTTTHIAHYTTDAYGRLEYVNPALERLCGYEDGEILSTKLALHHLIFSLGEQAITEEYIPQAHIGKAVLVAKRGQHLHGMVQQSVLRDAQGKLVGATGTVVVGTA